MEQFIYGDDLNSLERETNRLRWLPKTGDRGNEQQLAAIMNNHEFHGFMAKAGLHQIRWAITSTFGLTVRHQYPGK